MKIAALLTGRGNNTLKNKNILPVLGKPLLYYPAMAAKSCELISDFFVSSDDEKILTAAAECGYSKILRPAELALPMSQHIDAIIHALKVMKEEYNCVPDILVVLLANSGIVKKEWVKESIQIILKNNSISATAPVLIEMDHHPYRSKRLRKDGCLGTWFNFENSKISTNRQDLPMNFVLCHNFWTLNLKESVYAESGQQPWTFMGNNIKPIVVEESFDVHDENDLIRTEKWLLEEGIEY